MIYELKAGDTFRIDFTARDPFSTAAVDARESLQADPTNPTLIAAYEAALNASPLDLRSQSITSQVRFQGDLTSDLVVTVLDAAAGRFRLSQVASETESWIVGDHDCDIQFVDAANGTNSSDTFTVRVKQDVTRNVS